jgi:Right handed beta helix region
VIASACGTENDATPPTSGGGSGGSGSRDSGEGGSAGSGANGPDGVDSSDETQGDVIAFTDANAGDASSSGTRIYVSPTGSDSNAGNSASAPVATLQKAQALVRTVNSNMSTDVTIVLADGYYRMKEPLTLDPSDSGTNGHNVVWTAADGAHPVVVGSVPISGWSQVAGAATIWSAQGPKGIQTRQLYVDGARATRATGAVPTGATLGTWKDPSGQFPPEVEFVYTGGTALWNEPRCPVASVTAGVINMVQPCWDNSTKRGKSNVGKASVGAATRAENAYQLLDAPGEWYLDTGSSKFYYIPLPGQDLAKVDVEAPVLEALVGGGGTADKPLHNVVFNGIQFSYATWMGASGPNGFSEVQANYLVWGADPTAGNAEFNWYQIPANVSLTYGQKIQFTNDAFVHLGAAGLGLGNGSQNCVVEGNVFTDISGNTIELGNVDKRNATGADQTIGNTIKNNHIFNTPVEFIGGIGIDVAYAAVTTITHNQIDHTPYSGISVGWAGWPDEVMMPGLANFSHNNEISYNLLFNVVQKLQDGGAIYTVGQTAASQSFATGETVKGNVIHDQPNIYWEIYTDNAADWVTITGNAAWNPS